MRKIQKAVLVCLLALSTSTVTPSTISPANAAFSNGMNASLVIGQSSFATRSPATTQSGFSGPAGGIFDSTGNFWVADFNNRVLEFTPPFSNGMSASLVIGQSSFTTSTFATTQSGLGTPAAVAFDSAGNLWVADLNNNRVLEFTPPFSNGMSASLVIGQSSFTTSTFATTQSGLAGPAAVAFDSAGNLWVGDANNNRVLEFKPPFSSGMSASLVIGQSSFTTSSAATTQSGLHIPEHVAFDSTGNLWLTDDFNNRVLEFTPPFSNGMSASLVIGQSSFTTSSAATTQSGLNGPIGVTFDSTGNLWIVEDLNHRVLEFTPPFSNGMSASLVIGQSSFTTNSCGLGQSGLCLPGNAAFDSSGNLWVTDFNNNRVLKFRSDSPPVVSFTEDKTTANTGDTITVTYTSSDPDGTVVQVTVDWGDGTVHTFLTASGTDTYAYANTGNALSEMFTVNVTAKDDSGLTTTASAVKTILDRPPIASFTESASTVTTGTPIRFDASSSSDPDGTIVNYSWDFGDTSTGSGVTITRSYAVEGTFTVTLTVTDNSGLTGSAMDTKSILNHITVSKFFTDSSFNPLPLDNNGNPKVDVVLARSVVKSTNPGEIIAWVNVTNPGPAPLQSLKLNEILPVDWVIAPPWLPGQGGIHVYFENSPSLVKNLEITDPTTIAVIAANPEVVHLAIPDLSATLMGHALMLGQTILLAVKLDYGLDATSQPAASYPRGYADKAVASGWTQSSYTGAQAFGTASAIFTAYAKVVGDVNGEVDIVDLSLVARAFGSKPGDANWNPAADLNNVGMVDISDLALVGFMFGS